MAVVGNVDAGKSTLLGVLTHGELDNGRGTARMKLFRHKHEMESGRTSSVGNDILGFDGVGNVVNKAEAHGKCTCMLVFNQYYYCLEYFFPPQHPVSYTSFLKAALQPSQIVNKI